MNGVLERELENRLGRSLFELVPFNVAVIDRDFHVLAANGNFKEYFGEWHGRHCYEICKGTAERCANCQAMPIFDDGRVRVSDELGVDRHGRASHFVVHLAPVKDADGRVQYVIQMTTDLTETRRWQREYDLFFERVPCYVSVIDRNLRIVRANEKFREGFGEAEGRFCYEVYKRRKKPCPHCPAALTFEDGADHVSKQVGVHQDGTLAYYVVTASALSRGRRGVRHVIEMASDITEIHMLETKLRRADDFHESLVRNSPSGILAVDTAGEIRIINPAARSLLNWKSRRPPTANLLRTMLPAEFFGAAQENEVLANIPEASLHAVDGEEVPVRFSAVELRSHGSKLGRAALMQDLREVKRLEQQRLEAERLAAVGQTVAGLAHSIKNLLMGLEGGMYMVDTGIRRGDADRLVNGWQILKRNFEKTTALVKDFLSFAKGRLPELELTDPNVLARNIVELYRDAALKQGVALLLEACPEVREAMLDPRGMETCLTNLVSNGIDAATTPRQRGGRVVVRTREEGDDLVFEVADNGCGIDQEVKSKVFTTFFTTKGGKGTGLGLLTTRKIVQEHGGQVEMESLPGQGSTFRIRLPRAHLKALAASHASRPADERKP
ncbi:MAG: PAS domain-containing protein [Acidobacteriota bacterium]